ncbi:DUF4913 domain-containing protein [Nocardiopsis ganjiahuensis]|uniref:DUF4913 domain-containing protein n=1 Tax=Nocardiopsis ganjiahuensis TaxID=239984 RepID=UPI00034A3C90|nr:DUF4913 domain-containing protein [Nocardiopsis ganjiahuensis]
MSDTSETADNNGSSEPLHTDAVDFFDRYFRHVYKRRVGVRNQHRWSARWWDIPEVVIRMDAIWRAWESLSSDPTVGMSTWLRDHADYHMSILLSPDGPMANAEDSNQHGEPLPHEAPPEY